MIGASSQHKVVKSSLQPAKITAYLVSIGQLLCLAFLYGWRFLHKISLDWPLTLTTQSSTSKLSDNPAAKLTTYFVLLAGYSDQLDHHFDSFNNKKVKG